MINIRGWLVGIFIFAGVYIMFMATQPVIDVIISSAKKQTFDPNVEANMWPIIDFVVSMWHYSVWIAAGGAVLYILWCNFIKEVETGYRY
jgi:hypothetical protein